jgi:hypothetical protein
MAQTAATEAQARLLLRHGATYGRLQEAQCNGDYPADDGQRETMLCDSCGTGWAPSSFVRRRGFRAVCWRGDWRGGVFHTRSAAEAELGGCPEHKSSSAALAIVGECPDCRTERLIRQTCRSIGGLEPNFQGDPRGHTVRLQVGDAPPDPYERPALAIPTS